MNAEAALVFLAAVAGRLPALGAWWNRDDWSLLARAAGLVDGDAAPARWLSRVLYWDVLHPLFGLAPDPWTWTRLLLHGLAAALTLRIAARLDFGPAARLGAGLLAAVTPLAFTPLLGASGVQELLGAVLALAAVDLALGGGPRRLAAAVVCGAGAILSKENALLLPVLLGGLAAFGPAERRRSLWAAAAALGVLALFEATLVWSAFDHGDGLAYDIDPFLAPIPNLLRCGWWLAAPIPVAAPDFGPVTGLGGAAVWALWGLFAWRGRAAGDLRPAALLAAAVLSLAPALLLTTAATPHLAYLAWFPLALTLAGALLSRLDRAPSRLVVAGACLAAAALAWGGTQLRLKERNDMGLPADPTVQATSLSHLALRVLDELPGDPERIVILQPEGDLAGPARLSPLYAALGGDLGPRLALPDGPTVAWRPTLTGEPASVPVLADDGVRLRWWGGSVQARLLLVLTRVGQGRHDEAVDLLLNTLRDLDEVVPVSYSQDALTVPPASVRRGAPAFLRAIENAGLPVDERDGLLAAAQRLLDGAGLAPSPDVR